MTGSAQLFLAPAHFSATTHLLPTFGSCLIFSQGGGAFIATGFYIMHSDWKKDTYAWVSHLQRHTKTHEPAKLEWVIKNVECWWMAEVTWRRHCNVLVCTAAYGHSCRELDGACVPRQRDAEVREARQPSCFGVGLRYRICRFCVHLLRIIWMQRSDVQHWIIVVVDHRLIS